MPLFGGPSDLAEYGGFHAVYSGLQLGSRCCKPGRWKKSARNGTQRTVHPNEAVALAVMDAIAAE
ncbi:hypothetical protein D5046_20445 [Verminephrobacter eiseniae]|nr:hypothetical protein [Verminephrobacter eiseniae]